MYSVSLIMEELNRSDASSDESSSESEWAMEDTEAAFNATQQFVDDK